MKQRMGATLRKGATKWTMSVDGSTFDLNTMTREQRGTFFRLFNGAVRTVFGEPKKSRRQRRAAA